MIESKLSQDEQALLDELVRKLRNRLIREVRKAMKEWYESQQAKQNDYRLPFEDYQENE